MHTCDNCGRELVFKTRVVVCCNIVYRSRLPSEEERRYRTDRWNERAEESAQQFKDREEMDA